MVVGGEGGDVVMVTMPIAFLCFQERGLDAGTGSSGSMETSLRKGCVSGRQVNGVINRYYPLCVCVCVCVST